MNTFIEIRRHHVESKEPGYSVQVFHGRSNGPCAFRLNRDEAKSQVIVFLRQFPDAKVLSYCKENPSDGWGYSHTQWEQRPVQEML